MVESRRCTVWTPCYIALGANLDAPAQQVTHALSELQGIKMTRVIAGSSLYESVPMGPQDQPAFINAVAGLLTQLPAVELLAALQDIEHRMGRQVPALRWGPRVIDLDLLMHGDTQLDSPQLQLPHPGMLQRNFVMAPLAEIAPELRVAKGRSAVQVARALGLQGLRRLNTAGCS